MALSPGIPTSFVPKQPVQAPRRKASAGTNLFLLASLAVAGVALLASGAVFAYDRYLTYVQNAKEAELAKAQAAVNPDTVQEFIRLKDRFNAGETLLNQHVTLSRFFDELEAVTLQNIQFSNLTLTVTGDGTAKLQMDGVAKNFNALAAQSNAVAADKNIKRAIFSGIGFDNGNTRLKFQLTADLDPSIIRGNTAAAASALPAPIQSVPVTTTASSSVRTATTTP